MNCAECRDLLIACLEGLLEPERSQACHAHLQDCAGCRAEYAAVTRLQQRLVARGQVDVCVVEPVMQRIHRTQRERTSIMSKIFRSRWGFGLSAATGVAAVIALVVWASPRTQATAGDVMAHGARAAAKITSIHFRGQMRTAPQDNFAAIMPDHELVPIELWKEFTPELKWRVEKPGRVAVMDGQSTVLFIRSVNAAMKVQASNSAFDTQWLHQMANLSDTLEAELRAIKAHGWAVTLGHRQGNDGRPKSAITIEAKSGLPDSDYLKNKFFMTADTRRSYVFDDKTELLESVEVYMHGPTGDRLILEIDAIEYNQPFSPGVFQLGLPADVAWHQEPSAQPADDKIAGMTAEQAARTFFEACSQQDWDQLAKFWPLAVNDQIKQHLGGLEIVSIGASFTSAASGTAQFVPYEIKLRNGQVKKWNLALKKDARTGRWFVDGGI